MKQLKRKHRLKLRAKVAVKNAAGGSNSARGTIRLSRSGAAVSANPDTSCQGW